MEYSVKHNDFLLTRIDLGNAGFNLEKIKKAVTRGQIQAASRGQYLYSSLGAWQQQVKDSLCDGLEPAEWQVTQLSQTAEKEQGLLDDTISQAIERGYLRFLNHYKEIASDKDIAIKYARAAAVVESVICYMQNCNIAASKYGWFKDTLVPAIKDNETAQKYNFDLLPKNPLVLQRDYFQPIMKKGTVITEVVKIKRAGNDNRSEFKNDDELYAQLMFMRSRPANFSNIYIARIIKYNAYLSGKTEPSDSWFNHEFAKPRVKYITSLTRFNEQSRQSAAYDFSLPIKNALYANDCWQADGTRINMIPHAADGKEKFLYIIAVRDVHSGDILGMHLGYTEGRFAWISALRMAAENAGCLPYQLVIDRFPGHNSPEGEHMLTKLEQYDCKVTKSHKATGKAQMERWFGTLQSVFMMQSKYYYGEGVQSTRTFAHRSDVYLKEVRKEAKKDGFDAIKAITETVNTVEMYRNTPFSAYSKTRNKVEKSPAQLFIESEKPNSLPLSTPQLADIFWACRKETLRSRKISFRVNGELAEYCIDNEKILEDFSNVQLDVRFDETDLSTICIFDPDRQTLIAQLNRTEAIQIYGKDAEFDKLGKLKAVHKALDQHRKVELQEASVKALQTMKTGAFVDTSAAELVQLMARSTPKPLKEAEESHMLMGNNDEDIDVLEFTQGQY